jgi:hypothetical protein
VTGRKASSASTGHRRCLARAVALSRGLEWSAELGTWRGLDPAGHIEDAALETPLPIEAMLHAARADNALARVLVARRNPVIEAVRAEDRAAGKAEGVQEGFLRGKSEAVLASWPHGKSLSDMPSACESSASGTQHNSTTGSQRPRPVRRSPSCSRRPAGGEACAPSTGATPVTWLTWARTVKP